MGKTLQGFLRVIPLADDPEENSQINNISSSLKGFHILELHTPTHENCVGILIIIIAITLVLLVYRKYPKRLLEVKSL